MSARLLAQLEKHARARPRDAALFLDDAVHTWGELLAATCAASDDFTRRLSPHAIVAVIGGSGFGAWVTVMATLRAGLRVMLLPPRLPDRVLAPIAAAFRPEVVCSSGAADAAAEVVRLQTLVAQVSLPQPGATPAHSSVRYGPELLLFSSGTTGRPRAIVRSAAALDRVAATLHREIDFGPRERVLSFLPMHHAYGLEHALLAPILGGAMVEQRSTSGPHVSTLIAERRITILPATPILLEALADAPLQGATHTLRRVYSAGSPLPATVATRMHRAWGVRVDDLYGASELGTITLSGADGFRTVPGVELRVVDPEVTDTLVDRARGEQGEIVVRSDAMFEGYADDRDATPNRGRTIDGFFRTGDLGVMAPSGPRIVGRLKLQYDIGGLKVNAEEVERVLARAPGVARAVVLPLPVSETLNRLRAVVEPRAGATIDRASLVAFARANLAPHEVPRDFEIVEQLPSTPSGKLQRGLLMERVDAVP